MPPSSAASAEYKLRHLDKSAVAKVIEYGSRLAEDQNKLTTRFSDVTDLIQEAGAMTLVSFKRCLIFSRIKKTKRNRDQATEMNEFMKKWGLIGKALMITAILVAIRLIIDISNYDIIALTNLITAFIGAAIFTVAVIFTGTLTDYKESEKIPNDIAVSLLTLHHDSKLFRPSDNPISVHLQEHVRNLARIIVDNFKTNTSDNGKVRAAIAEINEDLCLLVDQNAPPQYVNKIRTELGNIDKITSRVKTIAETSFIPAAYAIAEISVVGVILILFFVKIDPYYEGMIIFSIIIALLISIILLIKDMDNPFEYGQRTFADVDLSPILEIEKYLD
jgi:hypothetical protein